MNVIRFGSVCSGIEAASVAWHPLGWRAAWLAEIEPFPCAVLAHHYPDVPNLGDMTALPDRIASGEIEAPEIFCGGTPCQAFSVAGLRKSLDDARGNLSLTFCEISNAIDSARHVRGEQPAIIFWENVPGVLNTKDNAFGCFLGALAGEDDPLVAPGGKWTNAGCVYGPQRAVAWRILDAQYFGVAQRRRRVFVVASARTGFDPAAVLFEFDGVRRDTAPSREAGKEPTVGTIRSTDGGCDVDHIRAGHAVAFGGNNQSGPIDVATARNACASASGRMDFETETFLVQPAFAIQAGALRTNPASGPDGISVQADHAYTLEARSEVQAVAFHPTQDPISNTDGTTHALGCGSSGGQASIAVAMINMQGSKGNAVAQADSPSFTLNAMHGHDVHAVVAPPIMQVRRLTPRECEALQGFPQNYTAIPWRKKPASECPDGPRYKALGNSWAVPNVRWIGRRIDAHLRALSGSEIEPGEDA
jgi:DNA (cytosine-5)-methyltransferase 1